MKTSKLSPRVAVVIPAYQCANTISQTIKGLVDLIDLIVVVNDGSGDQTGEIVSHLKLKSVYLINHERNLGVGAAVKSGIKKALESNAEVIVKMDGDNQMNPVYLDRMVQPLKLGLADCTKGTRWVYGISRENIPSVRRLGNTFLALLTRFASGYWNLTDPNNGYLAWRADLLKKIDWDQVHNGYFFESSMLVQLNLLQARVFDVPMLPRYQGETSNLKIWKVIPQFSYNLIRQGLKRWWYKYFLYDMNAVSIFLIFGSLFSVFGLAFGIYQWVSHSVKNIVTPTGTVMIAVMPLLVGIILLIQALVLDITESRKS